jgi:RNA polymerase sigma factor (sigma-70 family)
VARSFPEVYKAEFAPLYRYLNRRVGSSAAEDLAAETFTIAFRRWNEFDPSRPVKPWLYGIAANLLRHYWRKERRMLRAYARAGDDPVLPGADASYERLERAPYRALSAAVADLERGQREVVLLHVWADLSDAEIAEALGISLGTVKSRLSRARERLRNQLQANGQIGVDSVSAIKEKP